MAAMGLLLVWAGRETIVDSLSMSLSCRVNEEPIGGLVARYTNLPRTVELSLITPAGSNFFVKLAQPETAKPVLSIFVHGGVPVTVKVPLGSFILKAASGEHWCGETNLFGGDTVIVETGRTIEFQAQQIHTVTLSPRPDGNLPMRPIARGKF
jgi:hypothetical protein